MFDALQPDASITVWRELLALTLLVVAAAAAFGRLAELFGALRHALSFWGGLILTAVTFGRYQRKARPATTAVVIADDELLEVDDEPMPVPVATAAPAMVSPLAAPPPAPFAADPAATAMPFDPVIEPEAVPKLRSGAARKALGE